MKDYTTLPFPNVESAIGDDVKLMDLSIKITQGSLTYCENKVKSKSKIVIYKHVSVTIYK